MTITVINGAHRQRKSFLSNSKIVYTLLLLVYTRTFLWWYIHNIYENEFSFRIIFLLKSAGSLLTKFKIPRNKKLF